MAVRIQSHGCRLVPESALNGYYVAARCDQARREEVSEVVNRHAIYAGMQAYTVPRVLVLSRPHWFSVRTGE